MDKWSIHPQPQNNYDILVVGPAHILRREVMGK